MPTGSNDDMEMEPGAVGVAVKIETGIKYCPGMEITLPSYTFMDTKAHSSRVWPDRNIFELDKPRVAHTLLPRTGAKLSNFLLGQCTHHGMEHDRCYRYMWIIV